LAVDRLVFLGTPAFAVPSLEALIYLRQQGSIGLAGVVTQPDRPGHRRRMQSPPVKEVAVAAGVEVLQPARLRDEALDAVLSLRPTALVWAAYGNLIPKRLLDAVEGRALNVHPSLLPRWRGAEPVAYAILAGDEATGVTLMEGTAALDAGGVVAQERVGIAGAETTGELEARLALLGARLLERELLGYLAGDVRPTPQDEVLVTWAPKLDPARGQLDLGAPAAELARVVRAYTPDPGAYSFFRGTRLGILRASAAAGAAPEPGTLRLEAGTPHVATGSGWLRLEEVRPAGKRVMPGADWARGLQDLEAARLPS
jgi:methionyl-tRNA formyltransferase